MQSALATGSTRRLTFASCFQDACEMLMSTILKELQSKSTGCREQASLQDLPQPSSPKDSGPRAGLIITGKTLEFALQENLQRQFLELTAWCQAVICCRATPLQKSEVVKLVRNRLQVLTLAIGEWGLEHPSPPHQHPVLWSIIGTFFLLCFPCPFFPSLFPIFSPSHV